MRGRVREGEKKRVREEEKKRIGEKFDEGTISPPFRKGGVPRQRRGEGVRNKDDL